MSDAWQTGLSDFVTPRAVLVGIGNRLRGDDAFGPILIDRLQGRVPWPLVDTGETPENYVGKVLSFGPDRVLLLDAVRWGEAPGTLGFFRADEIPWGGASTHGASLRLFADLLRAENGCVSALLGPEPACTDVCAPLGPDVERSVADVDEYLTRIAARMDPADRPR